MEEDGDRSSRVSGRPDDNPTIPLPTREAWQVDQTDAGEPDQLYTAKAAAS